jgi:hypothetical protein
MRARRKLSTVNRAEITNHNAVVNFQLIAFRRTSLQATTNVFAACYTFQNFQITLNLSVCPCSKLSVRFRSWYSSVLPSSPYICMKTLASVPAPFLSPVHTVISYGIPAFSHIMTIGIHYTKHDLYNATDSMQFLA